MISLLLLAAFVNAGVAERLERERAAVGYKEGTVWKDEEDDWRDLSLYGAYFKEGHALTVDDAARLEKKLAEDPEDIRSRYLLLIHLRSRRDPEAIARHKEHSLWIIRNIPGSKLAVMPDVQLFPREAHGADVLRAWEDAVAARPKSADAAGRAGQFLDYYDDEASDRFFKRAVRLEPKRFLWRYEHGYFLELGAKTAATHRAALKELETALSLMKKKGEEKSPVDKPAILQPAAHAAIGCGKLKKAAVFAEEFSKLAASADDLHAPSRRQAAVMLQGRLALAHGRIEEARRLLLKSCEPDAQKSAIGRTPDMRLLDDFEARGERETLANYARACHASGMWPDTDIDECVEDIMAGKSVHWHFCRHYGR